MMGEQVSEPGESTASRKKDTPGLPDGGVLSAWSIALSRSCLVTTARFFGTAAGGCG